MKKTATVYCISEQKYHLVFFLSSTCAESDLYLCGSTIGYLLAEQLSEHAQYAPIGYLLAEQLSMRSMLLLDICWLNS